VVWRGAGLGGTLARPQDEFPNRGFFQIIQSGRLREQVGVTGVIILVQKESGGM
jgi:hypothetical protein